MVMRASPEFSPALVSAVRSGFDAFVLLQCVRFSRCYGDVAAALGDACAPPALATVAAMRRRSAGGGGFPATAGGWSNLFLSRLRAVDDVAVADPTAALVWELVSVVIEIIENGGDDAVNASMPYLEWYRTRCVSVGAVEELRRTLESLSPRDSLSAAEERELSEGVLGPLMTSILRTFLVGLFQQTAQLIHSLMDYLRACVIDPFAAEEESALTDVIHLLLMTIENSTEHSEWVSAANALIVDCKRIFTSTSGGSSWIVKAAQELKSLCLDILLMISGDAASILETCHLLELDVIEYVAAVCAICKPYMTLRELHHVYQAAWELWQSPVSGPWYVGVVERVLASRCITDLVAAMDLVGQAVRCNEYMAASSDRDWDIVSSSHGSDIKDWEEDEENVSMPGDRGRGVSGDPLSLRRFALLFMAAHVADICAPPFGAAVDQIHITFTRNQLVEDFVSLFQHHPLLWRTAATYVVYSPFMNPELLFRIITERAADALNDRYTFLSLHTFIFSCWDEKSDFQVTLRRLLHGKYPLSQTVNKWIDAVDYYRRKADEELREKIILGRVDSGDIVPAVWLAVECQQTKSLQIHFEHVLRSPEALQSEEVFRVGRAVSNNFIAVDTCPGLRMLHALNSCAALAEYRRALTNINELERTGDGGESQLCLLRAAERALRCAVSFAMHPATVFAVVEETAGAALALPKEQRPDWLIPLFSHALELVLTRHPAEGAKYLAQAAAIREIIMKLV